MKVTRTYLKAKNGLLLNIGAITACILFVGLWYGGVHSRVSSEIRDLRELVEASENMYLHGLISMSHSELQELDTKKTNAKKIDQLQRLFPGAKPYVFSDDPSEFLGLQETTLKLLTKPANDKGSYIQWLRNSFTTDMDAALQQSQKELGEVLPIFFTLESEQENTKTMYGKVDLENIVTLVQNDFFSKYGIPNAQGALGIRNVSFDKVIQDLGYYEIAIRVEGVPSNSIMSLLDFLSTLGAVHTYVDEANGVPTVIHQSSIPERTLDRDRYFSIGRSALSNPLVTVSNLMIEPTGDRLKDVTNTDADSYLTLSPRSRFREWNMTITLRFYIRGAASMHLEAIKNKIHLYLSGTEKKQSNTYNTFLPDNKDWSLRDRLENAFLTECTDCTELPKIRQLRYDLDAISDVYDRLIQKYVSNDAPLPMVQMQQLLTILDVIQNIEKKFLDLYDDIS